MSCITPARTILSPKGPRKNRRARAGGSRRRIWRHRHQPALCRARVLQRHARRGDERGQPLRRGVADFLVADHRGERQVRGFHPQGGQPGRGRHFRAAGPDPWIQEPAQAAAAFRGYRREHFRSGPALRRRHHHAIHIGAVRHRRAGGRHRSGKAFHRAVDVHCTRGALCLAETGHERHRQGIRPVMVFGF